MNMDEYMKAIRMVGGDRITKRERDLIVTALTMGDAQTAAQWIMAHRIDVRNGTICTPNAGELRDYIKSDVARAMLIAYNRNRANGMRMLVTERMQDEDDKTFNAHERFQARLDRCMLDAAGGKVRGKHVDAAVTQLIMDRPTIRKTLPTAKERWENAYSHVRRSYSTQAQKSAFGFDTRDNIVRRLYGHQPKIAPGVASLGDFMRTLNLRDKWEVEFAHPVHRVKIAISGGDCHLHGAAIQTWCDLNAGGIPIDWRITGNFNVPLGDGYTLRVPTLGDPQQRGTTADIDEAMKRTGLKWYRVTHNPAKMLSEVFVAEEDISIAARACEPVRRMGYLIEYRIYPKVKS